MNFDEISTVMGGALALFGIIAMSMASITGFVYMVGNFIMNDRLKAWAKNEFLELFYSGVIFVVILAAVPAVDFALHGLFVPANSATDPITTELCNAPSTAFDITSPYHTVLSCHNRLAIYFLHSIFTEASNLGKNLYLNYLFTSIMADMSIAIEFVFEMAGFFTYQPFRGFFTTGNYIKVQSFDWLVKLMMLTKFQEIVITFVDRALFLNLLVVGILLRTFAFTRRLGGLLIAIAIALFFIFPMFYAFGALMINAIKVKIEPSITFATSDSVSVVSRMYIQGNMPLPDGQVYDLNSPLATMTPEERKKYINDGEAFKGSGASTSVFKDPPVVPGAVPGTNEVSPEALKSLEKGSEKIFGWFDSVMERKWYDNIIPIAYEEGGPVDAVARIAFFSGFFGFIAIMATIASIRSISVVLGGDVEIAGLTHLI